MLQGEDAAAALTAILAAEDVAYEKGVIEKCLKISDGDLRRAINLLQSAARLVGAGSTSNGKEGKSVRQQRVLDDDKDDEEMRDINDTFGSAKREITKSILDDIAGTINASIIEGLVSAMRKGPGRNYEGIATRVTDIVASGFSANEVLLSLFGRLIYDEDVPARAKNQLTGIFSEMDKRLIDGVDEHMAMLDLVLQLSGIMAQG